MVDRVLKSKGQSRSVTNGWWVSFCRRYSEVSLRTPATISTARAKGSCPEAINQYFDMLQDTTTRQSCHNRSSVVPGHAQSATPPGVYLTSTSRDVCAQAFPDFSMFYSHTQLARNVNACGEGLEPRL